jgi:quinoprotein relay system zinc metallohydrolase 2
MLDLLIEVCLAARPEVCATRLVPTVETCAEAAAADWVGARPALVLREARCAPAAEAVEPLAVVEVAPGVFVHEGAVALASAGNRGDIANLGFVIGEAAVAVIDAGGSRAVGEALYAAVRERSALPIRWLVLTHMHPDHVLGAAVFAEAGATMVGHARLEAALVNRAAGMLAALEREVGVAAPIGTEVVLPDEAVAREATLDLGGRTLLVEAHPTAHTDNDLTALDKMTGTWFVGDLVFDGHLPTVDGSALGWIALLDDLAGREVERIVPGHGRASLPWPEGGRATRDYLEALVEEARAAVQRGESLGEAAGRIGQGLRGEWRLFDAFNTRNATAVYTEVEWE